MKSHSLCILTFLPILDSVRCSSTDFPEQVGRHITFDNQDSIFNTKQPLKTSGPSNVSFSSASDYTSSRSPSRRRRNELTLSLRYTSVCITLPLGTLQGLSSEGQHKTVSSCLGFPRSQGWCFYHTDSEYRKRTVKTTRMNGYPRKRSIVRPFSTVICV